MSQDFYEIKDTPKNFFVKKASQEGYVQKHSPSSVSYKASQRLILPGLLNRLSFDKLGMSLSFLCAIHCILTPFIMLSIPIMARYYLAHPMFHWLLAALVLPVGSIAFYNGYKHHRRTIVWWLGLPGLFIISFVPVFLHQYLNYITESILMILGSGLVASAHYLNRKSCSCEIHGHSA